MGRKPLEPGITSMAVVDLYIEAKESQGISFRALSERSGVNRIRLQRCFNLEQPFYVDELVAVARALNLVPWKVLRDAEVRVEEREAAALDSLGEESQDI